VDGEDEDGNSPAAAQSIVHEQLVLPDALTDRLVEDQGVAFWSYDATTDRMTINDTYRRWLGLSEEEAAELTLDTLESVIHTPDRPAALARTERVLSGMDEESGGVFRVRSKDGRHMWLRSRFRGADPGPDGLPRRLVGSVLNVTPFLSGDVPQREISRSPNVRRQAAGARLAKMTDAVPVAIYEFMVDPTGAYSFPYVSRGFLAIHGVPDAPLPYPVEPVLANVHPDDLPAVEASIRASVKEMTRWHAVYRLRRDDAEIWVEGVSNPEVLDDGSILYTGYVHDVTERRLREFEIKAAREAAEQANHAKIRFLSTLSHELRTPLNGLLGMAQVLSTRLQDSQHSDAVVTILNAGRDVVSLIDELMDMSRIDSGSMRIDQRTFDLVELVRQVIDEMQPRAREGRIGLERRMPPHMPGWRVGDPLRIRQILRNLISNAIKYTDTGRVRIAVRAVGAAGSQIRFDVVDSGRGMSRAERECIFDPFFQGDGDGSSKTPVAGGLGLGLAIVKQLTSLMGGTISVASAPGLGTAMSVTLPLPLSSGPLRQTALAPARRTLKDTTPDLSGRLLLADDNPVNLRVLEAFLAPTDLQLEFATDGLDALDLFTGGSFDAVLLDIQMPGMDGTAAMRAMKAWEMERERRPVPIFAITGNVLPNQVTEYLEAGFDEVVAKPVRRDHLLKILALYLRTPSPA